MRFSNENELLLPEEQEQMPMMLCGHRAQGRATKCGGYTYPSDKRPPVCVICDCFTPIRGGVELEGRQAKCGCGALRPSQDSSLAFFEFKGEGSHHARVVCKKCHYWEVAHQKEGVARNVDPRTVIEKGLCDGFEPAGAAEFDTFYCGCRGWD